MTTLKLDAEALARYRNPTRWLPAKADRPVEYRLDSDGSGVAVSLPPPASLATMLTLPGADAFRRGSTVLTRPEGTDSQPGAVELPALATGLRSDLASLPDRREAGQPYRDVQRAAEVASARFGAYSLEVVRAFRAALPAAPASPKARTASPTASISHAEYVRRRRAQTKATEVAQAEHLIRAWLQREMLPVGVPQSAPYLYDKAARAIERAADDGKTLPDGRNYVYLGARTFYAVADRLLGRRRRTKHGYVYDVYTPEERELMERMSLYDRSELLDAMARLELERLRADEGTAAAGSALAPVVPLRAVS